MTIETIPFTGAEGTARTLQFTRPAGIIRATAFIAHCFDCDREDGALVTLTERLTAEGLAVAAFDYTGLACDDAERGGAAFARFADVTAALAALAETGLSPALLIGHSLAAPATIRATATVPGLKAVATIGAPFGPKDDNFADRLARTLKGEVTEVDLGGRVVTLTPELIDDCDTAALTAALHGLHVPLLVMHAPRDSVVGIANAEAIFTPALHPKSFIGLDDADHQLSAPADAAHAADQLLAWARRPLGLAAAQRSFALPAELPPASTVRVTEVHPDLYTQEVINGPDHTLISDEPVHVGGTNLGPNPYALLKAALGSCTSMTMRMYARVKKWPVEGFSVDVTHDKVADEEGRKDDRGRPLKHDVFTRKITIHGDLTDDQRARLIEMADRCPVHMTLHRSSRIITEAV